MPLHRLVPRCRRRLRPAQKGGRHILQQQPRAHPAPGEHREAAGNGTIPSQKLWRFAHSPPPRSVKCSSTSTTYGKAALEQVGHPPCFLPGGAAGAAGGISESERYPYAVEGHPSHATPPPPFSPAAEGGGGSRRGCCKTRKTNVRLLREEEEDDAQAAAVRPS